MSQKLFLPPMPFRNGTDTTVQHNFSCETEGRVCAMQNRNVFQPANFDATKTFTDRGSRETLISCTTEIDAK